MAITTAFPTSAKLEYLEGSHNLGDAATSPPGGNTFKLALIKATPTGTYGAASVNYSDITGNSDEASDSNSPASYAAGGATLTNFGVTTSGTSAFADFDNVTFSTVTMSADGCMIYNSSVSNKSVYVGDFGGTKTASGGDFTITFPTPAAGTAIIELA